MNIKRTSLTWVLAWVLAIMGLMLSNTASAATPGYQLSPEDILIISVWKEKGLESEVLVRPDGRISFPLIGHLQAAGRTPEQVQAEIEKRLKKFMPDPSVTVLVKSVAGNKVFVIGKVTRPGPFPMGSNVDVMQALAMAGGLTPYAKSDEIRILRRIKGKQVVFRFRYSQVADGKNLSQNIILKSGDVVVVQ